MAIKPKFFGLLHEGKFTFGPGQRESYDAYMRKFKEGKELEMTIAAKYKKRTSGQPGEETNFNGYLWGVVYKIIADEIGEMDMDYIHYWAQKKVGNVKGMPDGEVVPIGTSEMSGAEFADYCSRVRMWAGVPGNVCEAGLYIPEPNEADYA